MTHKKNERKFFLSGLSAKEVDWPNFDIESFFSTEKRQEILQMRQLCDPEVMAHQCEICDLLVAKQSEMVRRNVISDFNANLCKICKSQIDAFKKGKMPIVQL